MIIIVCLLLLSEYRDLFNTFDREHKGSVIIADLLAVSQQLGLPSNQADLDQMLSSSNVTGIRIEFSLRATIMRSSLQGSPITLVKSWLTSPKGR